MGCVYTCLCRRAAVCTFACKLCLCMLSFSSARTYPKFPLHTSPACAYSSIYRCKHASCMSLCRRRKAVFLTSVLYPICERVSHSIWISVCVLNQSGRSRQIKHGQPKMPTDILSFDSHGKHAHTCQAFPAPPPRLEAFFLLLPLHGKDGLSSCLHHP